MKYKTDVVIIGAGPVGLFAVFQAGMLKIKCHVIDTLDYIGGQCIALYPEKPIYDIPAYPSISAKNLVYKLQEQAAPFKPKYHLGQQVVELIRNKDGSFTIITSHNNEIHTKAVIIAAGCGAFGPNRPPLPGIESFEKKSIFYSVTNPQDFKDKNVVIAGGGDSAVDWALILVEIAKKVTIVHRRKKFRCTPDSSDKLHKLSQEGKIELKVPYQLTQVAGKDGILNEIEVTDFDSNKKIIKADVLLPFFGLSMDLGPILKWELVLDKKHIKVDPSTSETNIPGVYAVGDVATYAGKLKLILSGFSEVAMACHSIYSRVYPDQILHFQYSTAKGVS